MYLVKFVLHWVRRKGRGKKLLIHIFIYSVAAVSRLNLKMR
jgi:hypothetical protein